MNTNTSNNGGEKSLVVPTIKDVIRKYRVLAILQRTKTGVPCDITVNNTIHGTLKILKTLRLPQSTPVTALTRQQFDRAITLLAAQHCSNISIKSFLDNFRGLFARWCLPYYEDAGWDIPPFKYPVFRAHAARYVRPPRDLLQRVKRWYRSLKGEYWFAATMMLEFAMRNGDVLRLKPKNFVTLEEPQADGTTLVRHFLSYTPNKTANSSRRTVFWPILDSIWQTFTDYGGLDGLDVTYETFLVLNHDLRELGFSGRKASYELRKICIDHYYQCRGIEEAVAISGDSIRTIMWYYADPTREKVQALDVAETL